jgi:hypothetical protein
VSRGRARGTSMTRLTESLGSLCNSACSAKPRDAELGQHCSRRQRAQSGEVSDVNVGTRMRRYESPVVLSSVPGNSNTDPSSIGSPRKPKPSVLVHAVSLYGTWPYNPIWAWIVPHHILV